MTARLTDSRIFLRRDLCTGCGLDLAQYDEHTPRDRCKHADFRPERTRYFLPGAAMQHDIHLTRTPVGGMRDVDGTHLGDALADIPQHFVVHSPDGFEWGYGGSGPADLALNIVGLFVPPYEAWRLHQHYKFTVIAQLDRHGPHTITADSVRAWIRGYWEAHPDA